MKVPARPADVFSVRLPFPLLLARAMRVSITSIPVSLTLWHAKHASDSFWQWRVWRLSDPSLADFFWTSFQVECAFAAGCALLAPIAWTLLRPQAEPASPNAEWT